MNFRQLGVRASGLLISRQRSVISFLDRVLLPESLAQSRGVWIETRNLAKRPTRKFGVSLTQLIRIFGIARSQPHQFLELLHSSDPVRRCLVCFRQLQTWLRLVWHQGDRQLELANRIRILSERQQTRSKQQPRGTVIRLQSNRLSKSDNCLLMIASLLSYNPKIVKDQGMPGAMPQSFGKDLLRSIQVAILECLHARSDLGLGRRWNTLLRECHAAGAAKYDDPKPRYFKQSGTMNDHLRPNYHYRYKSLSARV